MKEEKPQAFKACGFSSGKHQTALIRYHKSDHC